MNRLTVREFIAAIRRLPADPPVVDPRKWYRTQKEHWLGWLGEYNTGGAYGRKAGMNRKARFAYNHIVEPKMLLWLISAARVRPGLVRAARSDAASKGSMQAQSAAIRNQVPWEVVAAVLWPEMRVARTVPQLVWAIERLPSGPPARKIGVWYTTQKEHWLGWLGEYNTGGAYGRKPGQNRDARYAYNHIANPEMLLWLASAAGVSPSRIKAGRNAAARKVTMPAQAGAVRYHVPWDEIEAKLWPRS